MRLKEIVRLNRNRSGVTMTSCVINKAAEIRIFPQKSPENLVRITFSFGEIVELNVITLSLKFLKCNLEPKKQFCVHRFKL